MDLIADAKFALIRAAKEHGEPLSRRDYQSWKAEQDDITITVEEIVEQLGDGDWKAACRATGIDPITEPHRWSDDELEAALTQAADKMGQPLRQAEYRTWREDYPTNQPVPKTISNRFGDGSWSAACECFDIESGTDGRDTQYTDDELEAALTQAADGMGQPLRKADYGTWREDQPTNQPNSATISNRFGDGSWSAACECFGIESGFRGKTSEYTTERLETTLSRAHDEVDDDLTVYRYSSWRAAHDDEPPSVSTMIERLGDGSWTEARRSAGVEHA